MMPEANTIFDDAQPLTVESLAAQLAACGLAAGQTVLVHTRMSALGWITGGPVAVIQALLRVVGPTGTLAMPTFTTDNTDPAFWRDPPVPEAWWPVIRAHQPAFDPAITQTRQMGAVADTFRRWPGAKRSAHPVGSFAALGAQADYLTAIHGLETEFDEDSPLGRLYSLNGYILLLGVGHSNNTSLHMSEYRAQWPSKRSFRQGSAMLVDGVRQWVTYDTLDLSADDFEAIGAAYEHATGFTPCRVGRAEARLFRQGPLVDFAVAWMERERT